MAITRGIKIVAENRKAWHEYIILDKFEAGIVLSGTEVKSIRGGKVNLKDSYIKILNGEMFSVGMHISPYEQGNRFNLDPLRNRKLLMHRHEIDRLYGKIKQDGLTLVPLEIYFHDGKVKVQVGLAKGKKIYDKRNDMIKKTVKRDIDRAIKQNR